MASHEILIFNGARPERQPANDTLSLTGPLDTVTHYITATGVLSLVPGGAKGIQARTTGNPRGNYSVDLQLSSNSVDQVASGIGAALLGGDKNKVTADYSVALGGQSNIVNSQFCVCLVGSSNIIYSGSNRGIICGGSSSTINDAAAASIFGGSSNDIDGGDNSFIGGGINNAVSGEGAVVVGGSNDTSSGTAAGIIAGQGNVASGGYTGVLAGKDNDATDSYDCVCGGLQNEASGTYSAVLGGYAGTANGVASLVLSGRNCISSADSSMAGGRDSVAAHNYGVAYGRESKTQLESQFALSGGKIANAGDAQTMVSTSYRQTTVGTPVALKLNAATDYLVIPADTCWSFRILVVGLKSDGAQGAGYSFEGVIRRDGTADPVFVGTPGKVVLGEDDSAWDCTVQAHASTKALIIWVTGAAATTVNWAARIEFASVQV